MPSGKTAYTSSFVYWTDKVQTSDTSTTDGSDQTYALINEAGNNAPAPWAVYTKAFCDFVAVALADMKFENVASDIVNTTQTKNYIDAAAFSNGPFDASTANGFTQQAQALTQQMVSMAHG